MLVNPLAFTVTLTGLPGQADTPAMVDIGAFWAVRPTERSNVRMKSRLFFIAFIRLVFGYGVRVLRAGRKKSG